MIENTIIVPDRTLEQRRAALRKANTVRFAHSRLKRDVKQRTVNVADVLLDESPELGTIRVLDLLLAMPAMGRVKAPKAMKAAGVSGSKTLAGLTRRQRQALAMEVLAWDHLRAGRAEIESRRAA